MRSKQDFLEKLLKDINQYIDEEVEVRYSERILSDSEYDISTVAKERKTLKSLPDVLTSNDIAKYMSISRRTVYELLKINEDYGGIPNFSVGNSRRVMKSDFLDWIEKRKQEQRDSYSKE
ncbi:helix-turn-helix domain-containing protein [Paenibacillus sp. FSL R7-0340]|uniref:helix-turn-helix domain-containing protein n=1 Tax=Paenibacillus sp. FSL R7-0340 TaxID=2921684 RepID=UPI0030FB8338